MTTPTPDTDLLLDQAAQGDLQARNELLQKYRDRLRRMIALRLDRRLAARVDPSDVIQETIVEADRQFSDYLRQRPMPFYLWLRQLAWQRLVMLHRRHMHASKRSVKREDFELVLLSDDSILQLAQRLLARGSSPSAGLRNQERRQEVHTALLQLKERDREILVLRYLEQLPIRDIARVLGISEGAVKVRQLRALERLQVLLTPEDEK
jgi:RNA polymerase sigma-70 factor, ECF subfamily